MILFYFLGLNNLKTDSDRWSQSIHKYKENFNDILVI